MAPSSTTRRRLLTTSGLAITGSIGGCLNFGVGGENDASDANSNSLADLSTDENDTVTAFGAGISGWVRTVRHDPRTGVALVEGAIDVSREADYRVRLGIVDENGVVLMDDVTDETLYDVGTNTVTTEFEEIDDCESCYSGLLQVDQKESSNLGPNETNNDGSDNNENAASETGEDGQSDEQQHRDEKEGGALGTLGSEDNSNSNSSEGEGEDEGNGEEDDASEDPDDENARLDLNPNLNLNLEDGGRF